MDSSQGWIGVNCFYSGPGSGVFGDHLVEINGESYEVWDCNLLRGDGGDCVRGVLMGGSGSPDMALVGITMGNDQVSLEVDKSQIRSFD